MDRQRNNEPNYPLTGFNKISYEEFLGIYHMIKTYAELSKDDKEIIDLLMLGLQKRKEKDGTKI